MIMCCRKDVNGFFAYPVNDVIAPGYSSIIKEPMDFSTMLTKIENDTYDSIMDYKVRHKAACIKALSVPRFSIEFHSLLHNLIPQNKLVVALKILMML